MKASALAHEVRKPLRVVRLTPDDFATTWRSKPAAGVAVGLRMISDRDENTARSAALAVVEHPSLSVAEFNDALVAGIVGAAVCDPNDASRDPEPIPCPRDMVRVALSSAAIRRLYHEVDAMVAECSPSSRAATDEEIDDLVLLLEDHEVTPRARRLLAAVLDELTEP